MSQEAQAQKEIAQNVQAAVNNDAIKAQQQAQLAAIQQQQAQQQQLMQHIEQQVQHRLAIYNLDIQRLAMSAQIIESLSKARQTGMISDTTIIDTIEQQLHNALIIHQVATENTQATA